MILKDSIDTCISVAGIEIRRGRMRSVCQAMETAQYRLVHQDIVGTTNKGREGLELQTRDNWATEDNQRRKKWFKGKNG